MSAAALLLAVALGPWQRDIGAGTVGTANGLGDVVATLSPPDATPSVWFPFQVPGCYASGSALGVKGETVTFSRATGTAAFIKNGVETNCAANQLRVGDWGALFEEAATEVLTNNCSTLSTQSGVSVTNSGFRQMYGVKVEGTGSVTVTANTAVAYNGTLPITVNGGSASAFTIATAGTVDFAVSGNVSRAFVTQSSFPVAQCCTGAACAPSADVATYAWNATAIPLAGKPFCISATVKAPDGAPGGWSRYGNSGTLHTIALLGTYNAANSVHLHLSGEGSSFQITLSVRDGSNTAKSITSPLYLAPIGGYTPFGGFAHAGPYWGPLFTGQHRFTGCVDGSGNLSVGADGFSIAGSVTGTGLGVMASTPATLYLGANSAGTLHLGSYMKDVEVIAGRNILVSPNADTANVGDSITLGYPHAANYLRGPGYSTANFAVGGTTISQILDSWRNNAKGKKQYAYLTVMGGTNDLIVPTPAATIWASFKTIIDEALADGKKVIALTVTPRNNSPGWTAGQQTELLALNALILGYSPGPGYSTVDTYTLLNDGSGNLQVGYDSGDHVHLSNAGSDAIAYALRQKFP